VTSVFHFDTIMRDRINEGALDCPDHNCQAMRPEAKMAGSGAGGELVPY